MSPRDPPAAGLDVKSVSSSELQATDSMCHHCFDVLLEELKTTKRKGGWTETYVSTGTIVTGTATATIADGNKLIPEFVESLPNDAVECPLFITWDKLKHSASRKQQEHRDGYELRGCIGTLSPKPLVSSIGEYALISALRDKRFNPVSLQEFPHLRVSVSLLVQYEDCDHVHDWTVGTHGIMIRWMDELRQTEYSSTYLPEVAAEQGWDQVTTVASLIRKAGYHGRVCDDLLEKIQCTRYQSSKQKVTFDEFVKRRGHDPSSLLQGDNDGRQKKSAKSSPTSDCTVQ
jgi:uncharacterized protein (TIGR00296 family)